ncbi:hypothetical protein FKM82_021670 [Ascaphus truei]
MFLWIRVRNHFPNRHPPTTSPSSPKPPISSHLTKPLKNSLVPRSPRGPWAFSSSPACSGPPPRRPARSGQARSSATSRKHRSQQIDINPCEPDTALLACDRALRAK